VLLSLKIRSSRMKGLRQKVADHTMAKEENDKENVVAAIRRAAGELGRAPSRGELRRITGLSHYKVLAEFPTLREAVRAAGLEPNPKGERIETDALMQDWKRVGEKLGRRPSRAEYVREGRYSAGAFVARFGSWGKIEDRTHHGGTETRRKAKGVSRELTQRSRIRRNAQHGVAENNGEKAIAFQWGAQLAQVPGPVAGKRRVTEAVAALVVSTLLGANSNWQMAISQSLELNHKGHEGTQRESSNALAARGINKERAVMGAPFDGSRMTNAPMNELGVVFLFGMVAAELGFQVESLQGKFPDCEAKREVVKGKWQRSRIEFEFESKNFHLHGHDPKGCDVVVCWRHNWKDCPEELEVIELCRIVGRKQLADGS
jgi:Homing endonuclease associated repeat